MQVTTARISPVVMQLEVAIPAETVKAQIEKAYTQLAKKAHIKGFRPGKAPRNVLKNLFDSQVQNDVANALVQETLPKALSDKNMTPVNQPSVEAGKVDGATNFSYKARFEVQPDVEDVKFEGFDLKRPSVEVTDKLVTEQLETLQKRHATLKAPETERAIKDGDVVTVDFTLSIDGKEIKDGGGQGVPLELGSGQVISELEAALLGKKLGAKATAETTFPEGHPRTDFRGKKGVFSLEPKEIKEKVLPKLDDEFAKDVGDFASLDALKADIKSQLEKALKERSETSLAEQIVQKLNDANPLEVPPSLVEQQRRIMEQEIALQARRANARFTREQVDSLMGHIHQDAEKKVRAGLLMAAIAKKHEFKVTDEDMEKAYAELAEETGKNVAKVKAEYRDQQRRQLLIGMILEDKILDFIEGKSKITDLAPGEELKVEGAEGESKDDKPTKKKKADKA
ncbi:MAG: trigger factor [Polyangiaceae bacterium]